MGHRSGSVAYDGERSLSFTCRISTPPPKYFFPFHFSDKNFSDCTSRIYIPHVTRIIINHDVDRQSWIHLRFTYTEHLYILRIRLSVVVFVSGLILFETYIDPSFEKTIIFLVIDVSLSFSFFFPMEPCVCVHCTDSTGPFLSCGTVRNS